METLANSKDPDEMQHIAAFHPDLNCLLRLKQSSVKCPDPESFVRGGRTMTFFS